MVSKKFEEKKKVLYVKKCLTDLQVAKWEHHQPGHGLKLLLPSHEQSQSADTLPTSPQAVEGSF